MHELQIVCQARLRTIAWKVYVTLSSLYFRNFNIFVFTGNLLKIVNSRAKIAQVLLSAFHYFVVRAIRIVKELELKRSNCDLFLLIA